MGQYVCTVAAWSVSSQGDMVKTTEYESSPVTVQWDPKREEALFICSLLTKNLIETLEQRIGNS